MKRTVKSMKCFLAGMFEKKQSEIATIYSMPNETEYHFPNYHSCLLYKTFYHTAVELEDEIAHIKLLKKSIAEKLEKSVDKLPNPIDLYEEMYALQSHGFELPQKYKEHYYNVRDSAAEIYEYRAFDCRLTIGPCIFFQ
ncbi:hypothetical protein HZS_6539 [Henneguya salminicola]|nr:hypothetical protein HZS_6539 [Henneguya salminicola]